MYGRWLTAQQKDERWQDNGDKKRLARHHPSDLLRLLTREWIGGGQHGVVSPVLRASPFRTFHVLRWGTWCACVYLHVVDIQNTTKTQQIHYMYMYYVYLAIMHTTYSCCVRLARVARHRLAWWEGIPELFIVVWTIVTSPINTTKSKKKNFQLLITNLCTSTNGVLILKITNVSTMSK